MQADTLADIVARMSLINAPTDLTIVCRDGRRFDIHKFVVCPQSRVLAKMCDIGMEEKRTGVIKHKQFDSATVELMIQHAYAGEYAVTKRPVPLWMLERDSELEDVEQEAREAEKEEAVGNENDLSQDAESSRLDIAAATSIAAAITRQQPTHCAFAFHPEHRSISECRHSPPTTTAWLLRSQHFHPTEQPRARDRRPTGDPRPSVRPSRLLRDAKATRILVRQILEHRE
jgi:hypothetical protein